MLKIVGTVLGIPVVIGELLELIDSGYQKIGVEIIDGKQTGIWSNDQEIIDMCNGMPGGFMNSQFSAIKESENG